MNAPFRPTLHLAAFFAAALGLGALPVGCNAGFDTFGEPNACDATPTISCFDCEGASISPVCGFDGTWACRPNDDVCGDICSDDDILDCVDACGDFVPSFCSKGRRMCPPIEGGVICEEPNPSGAPAWATSYGTEGYQGGRAVAVDHEGNVIVAGHFQQTLEFDGGPLEPVGGYDTFIAKHAPDGTRQWLVHYGFAGDERPSGLGVDQDGNIVVAIGVSPTASQPASAGPMTLLKLDPNGATLWERSYDVITGGSLPMLAVSGEGALTVVGSHSGGAILGGPTLTAYGETDIFVARLDAIGDLIWSRSFGGTNFDYVQDVDVDEAGNVFLAGSFSAPIAFGQLVLPHAGDYDGFVASLDNAGTVRWARAVGTLGKDLCARVAATNDGGAAVTASFEDTLELGAMTLTPEPDHGGALVVRVNTDGNLEQPTQLPGSGASPFMSNHQYSVAVDEGGHIIVAGQFEGTSDLVQPSEAVSALDMLLLRLSPDGTKDWGYSFGGFSSEFASDVAVGPDGQIAVVGEYFDGFDFGAEALPAFTEGAIFLSLFNSTGTLTN